MQAVEKVLHQGSEGSVLVGGIGRDFSLKVIVQSFPASSTHCSNWASSALGSNHGNEIVMTNWDHGRLSLHSFPYTTFTSGSSFGLTLTSNTGKVRMRILMVTHSVSDTRMQERECV